MSATPRLAYWAKKNDLLHRMLLVQAASSRCVGNFGLLDMVKNRILISYPLQKGVEFAAAFASVCSSKTSPFGRKSLRLKAAATAGAILWPPCPHYDRPGRQDAQAGDCKHL
jgi:hypothetical protein